MKIDLIWSEKGPITEDANEGRMACLKIRFLSSIYVTNAKLGDATMMKSNSATKHCLWEFVRKRGEKVQTSCRRNRNATVSSKRKFMH